VGRRRRLLTWFTLSFYRGIGELWGLEEKEWGCERVRRVSGGILSLVVR
jgi:hypothetical protein